MDSYKSTNVKALNLLYCIISDASEDAISASYVLMKSSLSQSNTELTSQAMKPTMNQYRVCQRGMSKFALRCFNRLSHDHETSGVQVASGLLTLPSYYITMKNFVSINLRLLRQAICGLTGSSTSIISGEDAFFRTSLVIFVMWGMIRIAYRKDGAPSW
jgi:hypothetical protein